MPVHERFICKFNPFQLIYFPFNSVPNAPIEKSAKNIFWTSVRRQVHSHTYTHTHVRDQANTLVDWIDVVQFILSSFSFYCLNYAHHSTWDTFSIRSKVFWISECVYVCRFYCSSYIYSFFWWYNLSDLNLLRSRLIQQTIRCSLISLFDRTLLHMHQIIIINILSVPAIVFFFIRWFDFQFRRNIWSFFCIFTCGYIIIRGTAWWTGMKAKYKQKISSTL